MRIRCCLESGGDATQLTRGRCYLKTVEMEILETRFATRGMLASLENRCGHHGGARCGGGPARFRAEPDTTTLKGGLQQLVDALEGRLNPAWLRKSTVVNSLEHVGEGWRIRCTGAAEIYDAVIVASPAWAAGGLLAATDAGLGDELGAIPYSSSITVNLVFDEAQLGRLPDGFGFLVPAVEGRAMLACTFVHRKFVGRTPTGKAVLRAFLGGAKNEALLDQSDEVLVATVRRELSEILGARVVGPHIPAEATQVSRWRRAMALGQAGEGAGGSAAEDFGWRNLMTGSAYQLHSHGATGGERPDGGEAGRNFQPLASHLGLVLFYPLTCNLLVARSAMSYKSIHQNLTPQVSKARSGATVFLRLMQREKQILHFAYPANDSRSQGPDALRSG